MFQPSTLPVPATAYTPAPTVAPVVLYMPDRLFSWDSNPKTVKGQKYGFKTIVLYMAPADSGGVGQFCPFAELAGCKGPCLNEAGRGAMHSVQASRKNKIRLFVEEREMFMTKLAEEIARFVKRTLAEGFIPLVRLNGTTDIKWENIPVTYGGTRYANLMAAFPDVQFYDYTKIAARGRKKLPPNYDLTFSYSGLPGFARYVEQARAAGMRIAVVFSRRPDPGTQFLGQTVIDGDDSDLRHLDPQGSIVALYAKGPAKKDTSGFVVQI